jgi:hypothetical protein
VRLTPTQFMDHPELMGAVPHFRDRESWGPWRVFLKAVYGEALEARELEVFRRHTGRSAPRPGGYPEAVCVVGCQSGKSRIAALIVAYEAAVSARQRDGSELFALAVAQDHRSSMRTLLSYATAPFEAVPALAGEVFGRTAESLSLKTGVTIAAYPCRPAAIRGLRAVVVVLDEIAFYTSSEGRPTDKEMLRAARSRVATTGGKVLILSSPYGQEGVLYELHRDHYGKDESPVMVWQASAADMNPTLPADYLERMREDDPEAYRSEVLGEFRSGVGTLFDPEALEAVVVTGRRELPRAEGVSYRAFVDPSGGRSDAFTLAIGHKAGDVAVVDVLRAWRPPFNPSGVVAEAAAVLKSYGVTSVQGDRYAGEWPREQFRAQGIHYEPAAAAKSDLYLAMLPRVNAGRVELLDLPDVLRELRGLERRRGQSGRDRVDHRPGAHDDRANAVAGLLSLLIDPVEPAFAVVEGDTSLLFADYTGPRGRFVGRFGRGL